MSDPSNRRSFATNFASYMLIFRWWTTGAYKEFGTKSRYSTFLSPRNQDRSLCRLDNYVQGAYFTFKSQVNGSCFIPSWRGTSFQVPLLIIAAYPLSFASAHWGCFPASWNELWMRVSYLFALKETEGFDSAECAMLFKDSSELSVSSTSCISSWLWGFLHSVFH